MLVPMTVGTMVLGYKNSDEIASEIVEFANSIKTSENNVVVQLYIAYIYSIYSYIAQFQEKNDLTIKRKTLKKFKK